jgi:hypothetical protein
MFKKSRWRKMVVASIGLMSIITTRVMVWAIVDLLCLALLIRYLSVILFNGGLLALFLGFWVSCDIECLLC